MFASLALADSMDRSPEDGAPPPNCSLKKESYRCGADRLCTKARMDIDIVPRSHGHPLEGGISGLFSSCHLRHRAKSDLYRRYFLQCVV